jgi:hypothetical protein
MATVFLGILQICRRMTGAEAIPSPSLADTAQALF